MQGATNNLLSLRTTRIGSGTHFILDGDTGTQTIDYLNVQDNDASGGAQLSCRANTEGCVDSGRNTNWDFSNAATPSGGGTNKNYFFFLE